jgi:hypothetical protein
VKKSFHYSTLLIVFRFEYARPNVQERLPNEQGGLSWPWQVDGDDLANRRRGTVKRDDAIREKYGII